MNKEIEILHDAVRKGDLLFLNDIIYFRNFNYVYYNKDSSFSFLKEDGKSVFTEGEMGIIHELLHKYQALSKKNEEYTTREEFSSNSVLALHLNENSILIPESVFENDLRRKIIIGNVTDTKASVMEQELHSAHNCWLVLTIFSGIFIGFVENQKTFLQNTRANIMVKGRVDQISDFFLENKKGNIVVCYEIDEENFPSFLKIITNGNFMKFSNSFFLSVKINSLAFYESVVNLFKFLIGKNEYFIVENIHSIARYLMKPNVLALDIAYVTGDSYEVEKNEKCDRCWAKQVCWGTQAYGMFGRNPSAIIDHDYYCNFIREIAESCLIQIASLKSTFTNELERIQNFTFMDFKINSIN